MATAVRNALRLILTQDRVTTPYRRGGLTARGKRPDFSGYCSFCKLTRRWFIDGSEKLKVQIEPDRRAKALPEPIPADPVAHFRRKNA